MAVGLKEKQKNGAVFIFLTGQLKCTTCQTQGRRARSRPLQILIDVWINVGPPNQSLVRTTTWQVCLRCTGTLGGWLTETQESSLLTAGLHQQASCGKDLKDEKFPSDYAFTCDAAEHLNTLKTRLQGCKQPITHDVLKPF